MGELHMMEFRFDTFYLFTFFETGIGWVQQLFENHVQSDTTLKLWPALWMLPTKNVYGPWPLSGKRNLHNL